MGFVYPLYVYPTPQAVDGIFTDVAKSACKISTYVIVNPGNGDEVQCPALSTWAAARDKLKEYGAHTIGYVHSSWGKRAQGEYFSEIDKYLECMGVEGIFVDEAATGTDQLSYYQQVYDYVKSKGPLKSTGKPPSVWLNPGTGTNEAYMNISDVIFQFESPPSSFNSYTPPAYLSKYPAEKTGMLLYSATGNAAAAEDLITRVSNYHAAWVTVVDGTWTKTTAPSYWSQEVDFIEKNFQKPTMGGVVQPSHSPGATASTTIV